MDENGSWMLRNVLSVKITESFDLLDVENILK